MITIFYEKVKNPAFKENLRQKKDIIDKCRINICIKYIAGGLQHG